MLSLHCNCRDCITRFLLPICSPRRRKSSRARLQRCCSRSTTAFPCSTRPFALASLLARLNRVAQSAPLSISSLSRVCLKKCNHSFAEFPSFHSLTRVFAKCQGLEKDEGFVWRSTKTKTTNCVQVRLYRVRVTVW